jgi:hypothetical protein
MFPILACEGNRLLSAQHHARPARVKAAALDGLHPFDRRSMIPIGYVERRNKTQSV